MPTYTIKAWINITADTKEQADELLNDFEQNADGLLGQDVSLSTEGELEEI